MNEIQEKITALRTAGWTLAAIADELGVHWYTAQRWQKGQQYPDTPKPVAASLDLLFDRKPPPRRRYPGTHHLQRKSRKE